MCVKGGERECVCVKGGGEREREGVGEREGIHLSCTKTHNDTLGTLAFSSSDFRH